MSPAWVDEVWQSLDREVLAGIARSGPEVVFATISGAHLYGFASPDSDVDLRGVFRVPGESLLGLSQPRETFERTAPEPYDLDWVAHELRMFARMMTRHNGNALEQLYSPLVVVATPTFEALRELGRGCVTRPLVRHYSGFARGRVERLGQPGATVKHLLYAYRVFLSGLHVMRTGEIVAHLGTLLELGRHPEVDALVERKRAGAEHAELRPGELEHHRAALARLDAALREAYEKSHLPDEPTTVDALEALVVSTRGLRARPTRRTIDPARPSFLTLAGSQAQGTAGPGSDVDLRGVVVAPLALRLSCFERFEQLEAPVDDALWPAVRARLAEHATARDALDGKVECVLYEVGKLVELAMQANPTALELLFADPSDWVVETPVWARLHAARHLFLTRKVEHTFLGYAEAQLKKIMLHRAWLLDPPQAPPTRAAFGLPESSTLSRDERHRLESAITDRLRGFGVDDLELEPSVRLAITTRLERFLEAAFGVEGEALEDARRAVAEATLGIPRETVDALRAERRYQAAQQRWASYERWRRERNPARATLEARFGYDTKHAMHLVRLMRMGAEALETGTLLVRRPDAEELRAIRAGALSFDALLEEAAKLRARVAAAAATTALPATVDRDTVDALVLDLRWEAEPR